MFFDRDCRSTCIVDTTRDYRNHELLIYQKGMLTRRAIGRAKVLARQIGTEVCTVVTIDGDSALVPVDKATAEGVSEWVLRHNLKIINAMHISG